MGVYAALGVAQALFSYVCSFMFRYVELRTGTHRTRILIRCTASSHCMQASVCSKLP
jgi:hypothetical protein